MERYLKTQIIGDLQKKMVFLGGPRQVGKTTLALQMTQAKQGYLNWDITDHREKILSCQFPPSSILIFDELHKYRSWRNYLKGLFDETLGSVKILVTGSARLDLYRFAGDSLQGRYHYLRLHPLSVAELGGGKDVFEKLLRLGGFPEPYLSNSKIDAQRWSREYRTRLLREDLMSIEQIRDIGNLELLVLRLPELVSSPLSINSLREDLRLSHKTVSHWLDILERLYAIFRISPFGSARIRAVKKEQKHYHFDWTLVADPAKRFENLVAAHLLKWVHYLEDTEGREVELRYFRDSDGREVDFVITESSKPTLFVECKWSDDEIGKPLNYLHRKFPEVPAWQIHASGLKDYKTASGIRVAAAEELLKTLV